MLKNLNTIKKQNEQDAEDDLQSTTKFLSELLELDDFVEF